MIALRDRRRRRPRRRRRRRRRGGAPAARRAAPAAESAAARGRRASDAAAPARRRRRESSRRGRPRPAPARRARTARGRRKVERSASLTLAARPRDIDAVSAPDPGASRASRAASSSPRRSARRTGGGGGTFELRDPDRATSTRRWPRSRGSAHVRERAQRAQDITGAVGLGAQPPRRTPARSARACCAARRADTADETASHPRAPAPRLARDRAGRAPTSRRVDNRARVRRPSPSTLVADRAPAPPAATTTARWTPGDAAATRCACSRSPPASR